MLPRLQSKCSEKLEDIDNDMLRSVVAEIFHNLMGFVRYKAIKQVSAIMKKEITGLCKEEFADLLQRRLIIKNSIEPQIATILADLNNQYAIKSQTKRL